MTKPTKYDLTASANNQPNPYATISSLVISDLTEKPHSRVIRSIREMLKEAGIDSSEFITGSLTAADGEKLGFYELPRFECELVITGLISDYSIPRRGKILKRWHALKDLVAVPETYNPLINNALIKCMHDYTMDSFSLSRLAGKTHSAMKDDIEETFEQLDVDDDQYCCELVIEGKRKTCYVIPRVELDVLIQKYDATTQDRILRHWRRFINACQLVEALRKMAEALRKKAESEREYEALHKAFQKAHPWLPKNLIEALELRDRLTNKKDMRELKLAEVVGELAEVMRERAEGAREDAREDAARQKAHPWLPKNLIEILELRDQLTNKNDMHQLEWTNAVWERMSERMAEYAHCPGVTDPLDDCPPAPTIQA